MFSVGPERHCSFWPLKQADILMIQCSLGNPFQPTRDGLALRETSETHILGEEPLSFGFLPANSSRVDYLGAGVLRDTVQVLMFHLNSLDVVGYQMGTGLIERITS